MNFPKRKTFAFSVTLTVLVITVGTIACSSKNDPLPRTGNERNFYLQNCASCHGTEGGGTVRGVQLKGRKLDKDHVKKTILNGTSRMPKFIVSEPAITDLSQWISDLQ